MKSRFEFSELGVSAEKGLCFFSLIPWLGWLVVQDFFFFLIGLFFVRFEATNLLSSNLQNAVWIITSVCISAAKETDLQFRTQQKFSLIFWKCIDGQMIELL